MSTDIEVDLVQPDRPSGPLSGPDPGQERHTVVLRSGAQRRATIERWTAG
jgi:hypothetical protein